MTGESRVIVAPILNRLLKVENILTEFCMMTKSQPFLEVGRSLARYRTE